MSVTDNILEFWLHDVGPKGWYSVDSEVDAEIAARYAGEWEAARRGEREVWCNGPRGTLAYLILTDQFPRNMFRGDPRAFATDDRARHAADAAIGKDWDLKVAEPERQFFYLPFMHSEDKADQDRCCALIESRLPETGKDNILHAHAHREVIQNFGRFPYRNEALGRDMTPEEKEFLSSGGYGAAVRTVKARQ